MNEGSAISGSGRLAKGVQDLSHVPGKCNYSNPLRAADGHPFPFPSFSLLQQVPLCVLQKPPSSLTCRAPAWQAFVLIQQQRRARAEVTLMRASTGGCLCGKTRYSADAEPAFVGLCHCHDCQKFTGSAFAAVIGLPKSAV